MVVQHYEYIKNNWILHFEYEFYVSKDVKKISDLWLYQFPK